MEAYESECVSTAVHVRTLCTACIWETQRLTRVRAFSFFFFSESERTRAKGVVAKEAWGDYKDLGL